MAKKPEQESAENYGLDPNRFKVLDDPKPVVQPRVPPPTDGVPDLLRGSLPQSLQLPPDFTDANSYKHIPVFRLTPPQPSAVAGVNSAVVSTSKSVASTESAGVVAAAINKALPGAVVGTGSTAKINNANLSNVADGPTYIRGTQQTGAINITQNGNFEADSMIPPAGWSITGGAAISYNSGNPQSGSQSITIQSNGTQFAGLIGNQTFACQPGDAFQISGWIFQNSTSDAGVIQLIFFDNAGLFISAISTPAAGGGSGTWTFTQASGVAPAATVFAQIKIAIGLPGVTDAVSFDNISVVRQLTAYDLTPTSTSGTPTATSGLVTQSGTSTTLLIAANTMQYGDGQVTYNSGSVNPGSLGKWYVYADDPSYSGGAVTYVATASPSVCNAGNGRVTFGSIQSVGGGGAVSIGGGTGGGGPLSKGSLGL